VFTCGISASALFSPTVSKRLVTGKAANVTCSLSSPCYDGGGQLINVPLGHVMLILHCAWESSHHNYIVVWKAGLIASAVCLAPTMVLIVHRTCIYYPEFCVCRQFLLNEAILIFVV
jgi:hypothetical protein